MSKKVEKNTDVGTEILPHTHPTYLIVADESEEFNASLHYAARVAQRHHAQIAVMCVLHEDENVFLPWGTVQDRVDQERRKNAEKLIVQVATKLNEYKITPSYYICEGAPAEIIRDIVNDDHNITQLILGGNTNDTTPGPLVSYFCGKGLPDLRVPLTIVPGNLSPDSIDRFVDMM